MKPMTLIRCIPALLGALTFLSLHRVAAASALAAVDNRPRYVEGELLVKFRGGPRGPGAERARAELKHTVRRDFEFIGWQHIKLPPGLSVEDALARYQRHPDVLAAEPNSYLQAGTEPVIPNDPLYPQQWAPAAIDAPFAWAETTGSTNVVIAVLDSGINYYHQDLAANMWRNPGEIPGNGLDDDANGWVDDVFGVDTDSNDGDPLDQPPNGIYHGTAIASVIGAIGNDGLGVVGLNWNVRLMAICVDHDGMDYTFANVLQGCDYILLMKQRGVNIRAVNMSFGGPNYSTSLNNAIDTLGNAGVIAVCIAHNNGVNIDVSPNYPASYTSPNIIAVASSDAGAQLAASSSYGPNSVDLAAPGVEILMAWGPGPANYWRSSGTSYAAPHVAGAVAMLAAVYPDWTVAQIKAAILNSVDVLPAFQGKVLTGGRLNVGKMFLDTKTNQPPVFIRSPGDLEVNPGVTVTLTVSCGGTPAISYQWYRDGSLLPDATNTALTLANVRSNTTVWVQASNAFGATSSPPATVTVNSLRGPVVAWGANNYEQCNVPPDATNVTALAGGRWHSLALRPDGTVTGWGDNGFGQASSLPGLSEVKAVAAGTDFSLALRSNGTVVAWGTNTFGPLTVPVGLSNVAAIISGQVHCLALRSNGTVVAWGRNTYGESTVPGGLANVMAVSGGVDHSAALLSNGTVVAWGRNTYGELNVPAGLNSVVAIVAGAGATLALKQDGTLVAWGRNNFGQLNIPPGLSNVVAISGYAHFLALRQNGTVVGWGAGSTTTGGDPHWGQAIVPEGLTNVIAIAGSGRHSLALVGQPPPPTAPTLAIERQAGSVLLSWPAGPLEWQLLYTPQLTAPMSWEPWFGPRTTNGANINTTVPTAEQTLFFRLRWP